MSAQKMQYTEIAGIPAVIAGEDTDEGFLFIHGKMGCKEEALDFAERAVPSGFQVAGIDLPEHGSRRDDAENLFPGRQFRKYTRYTKNFLRTGKKSIFGQTASELFFRCMRSRMKIREKRCLFLRSWIWSSLFWG